MLDYARPQAADHGVAPAQPRAAGEARVSAKLRDGRSVLGALRQQGSAKIRLLRQRPGAPVEAVFLNTAGGITGGDRFDWAAEAEAGAHLVATTQAAERLYKAQPGEVGRVVARLRVDAGARLDWLPQETIAYDGAALERRLEADIAPDGRFLAVESWIFGRLAMGEQVRSAHLVDQWRIRRDGELVFAEALRLSGPVADILNRPAALDGMRAMATLLYVAPDAEDRMGAARARLPETNAGASAWNGLLTARVAAQDGMALRAILIPLLTEMLGAPPPRVWSI
jgi:urease accessory protein